MSWEAPSTAIRQKDDAVEKNEDGIETKSFAWKGPYGDLEEAMHAVVKGDKVEDGWIANTFRLNKVSGGQGILTISCMPDDMTGEPEEEGDDPTQEPLKDIWSIKSVRNDVSVMAYCGTGENNPKRALIEAWMKEPDGKLAELHQYRNDAGEIVQLTDDAGTMDLVLKIQKGIESVIRFYPLVTRKRTYSQVPPACLENLGFIDTPPAPAQSAKNPGGLAAAVEAHQWLKVQDDADEQTDGNWTRTEAWMGIKKTDGPNSSPWDPDLYGTNRWAMPHDHQQDSIQT